MEPAVTKLTRERCCGRTAVATISLAVREPLCKKVSMTEFLTRTRVGRLDAGPARLLDEEGFLLLRGAIPAAWIGPLRDAFEAGHLASHMWPVPRGHDWRH